MSDLPPSARVVIVGGGVIGLSIAHHLGRLGEVDAVLFEREPLPGTGSSGASAGGIRQQFGEEWNILFAMEGRRQILAHRGETGFDPDFREHGYLLLAGSEATRARLLRDVALQNRLGLPTEFLEPAEIARRFPELETGDLVGAAFCGTDGSLDPAALLQGWRRSAEASGIRIETGTPVTAIERAGAAVTGVVTPRGRVAAEFVVDAGGPWGAEIAAMAGLALPLRPCRRQIFVTRPFPIRADLPLVLDLDHPFYFRPEAGGVLLSGAEVEETRSYDRTLDESGLEALVERAVHRCPTLAEAEISGGWAGIRTLTPDGSAILGDAPGVPGLLLAVGMSGHGITHAPAVGRVLAERIVHGAAASLPLEPFRADRFGAGPPRAAGVISG